jgi:deazaflavin-dependent oxidoreductase (nitroreductase family)
MPDRTGHYGSMTDEAARPKTPAGSTPDNPIDNGEDWVKAQIDEYVATDGAEPVYKGGIPLLLLTTRGRRSGEWRRTPLIYGLHEGRPLLAASLGGSPKHPSWYLNLEQNPTVRVQVGGDVFDATARTATADERAELWAAMVEVYPTYADYQQKTTREIPVVILDRT